MTFLVSAVPDAILSVLDGILVAWPALPVEIRQAVEDAVRKHGPNIGVSPNGMDAASAVGAFLDALWPVRHALPADVRSLLEAGQAEAQPSSGRRGFETGSLSGELRERVLQRMLGIVDFQLYRDPQGLATEVDQLADKYQGRLTDDELVQLAALRAAHARRDVDRDVAEAYLRAVKALLGDYPGIARLLDAPDAKVWSSGQRLRSGTVHPSPVGPEVPKSPLIGPSIAPSYAISAPRTLDAAATDEVTRYANVHFPNKVLLDQGAVPLIVHVAGHFQPGARGTADEARMSLKLSPLTVVVRTQGFEVTDATIGGEVVAGAGPHVRRVQVLRDRDCEPLIFFLKPQSAGPKCISVDFEQFGRRLVTVAFEAEVVDDAAALKQLTSATVPLVPITSPLLDADAKPPDLELRIAYSHRDKKLEYWLHSPNSSDYNFKAVGSVTLRDDPLTFLQPIFNRLSDLAKKSVTTRSADETRRALDALTAEGVLLYNELFSDELKREYNKVLRKKYRGKSLLITSDDPWIPWELVTPQDPGEDEPWDEPNDPPLCETFRLSRWVAGRGAPDQVKLATGVWVAPPDNLLAAQAESDYFAELHRRQWEVSLTGPLKSVDEVTQTIRGGQTHLFHFACHGNFDAANANESKLKLGTEFLMPRDIKALGPFVRKSKPVVFLNACHSGRVGIGLTQIGGWAQTFLDGEASAFIGALWEANDVLAAQFAQEFYNRLWGLGPFAGKRRPLGQAFHEARMAIKQADPANPTWLAYVLYGDPYGQVVLGGA